MSGPSTVSVVLLDDSSDDRRRYSELLSDSALSIQAIGPDDMRRTVEAVNQLLGDSGPRLVLLDYRLDDGDDGSDFRGGSVAAAIRDTAPDVPLVLLTTEEKFRESVATRPGMQDLFDFHLLKGDITQESRERTRSQLEDLALGFADLHASASADADVWERLSTAMGTSRERLSRYEQSEMNVPRVEAPAELARWILHGPLHWPGPLVDEHQVRVELGLDAESLARSEVKELIDTAQYDGLFASFGPRWWVDDVREIVGELVGDTGPTDSARRVEAISDHLGHQLDNETCVWCGSGRTVRSCYVCHSAVDGSHALRRLTLPAPAWAEGTVLCFRCIADGRVEANGERPSPGADELVRQLQTGELTSPLDDD